MFVSDSSNASGGTPHHLSDSSPAAGVPEEWTYETTVKKVEALMTNIESGTLELAEVFDQFADAVAYLRQCEVFLAQRQQQISLLIETLNDDGEF